MLLILHVLTALSGLGYASYVLARPSERGIAISYQLLILTIVSGVFAVLERPASLGHFCLAGLAYSLFTLAAAALARLRLRTA